MAPQSACETRQQLAQKRAAACEKNYGLRMGG